MNIGLRNKLIAIASEKQTRNDPSHDINHILRVLGLAEKIGIAENADFDILVPAALFHDVIVYPKDSPKSKNETDESAELAREILGEFPEYPKEKIESVLTCIRQCSYSKRIMPDLLEAKILQDADRLEATGAISIMRTFSSGGQMNRPLYPAEDPLMTKGPVTFRSSLDLFPERLLKVESGMHTKTAMALAKRRTQFLKDFLGELESELRESGIL